MTTLAITGIGGFIGLRLCERALAMGWTVRGLDVSPGAAERARRLGADVIVADINDEAALTTLFTGADWVFHTVAIVAEDGRREDYERVNVKGTDTVCRAATQAGVSRLVHLSSVMVYGFDFPADVTEDGPLNGQGNVYNDTKLASEGVALRYHRPEGLHVVVIRPGDVYGAGSQPWVDRPVALLKAGQFLLPDGGRGVINHVHVDNLLDGVLLAFEKPVGGEVFNITDGVATPCREFFAWHARAAGKSLRTAPAVLLMAGVKVAGTVASWLGKPAPASPASIYFLQRKNRYSIERARQRLGYEPAITLQEGMSALFGDPR